MINLKVREFRIGNLVYYNGSVYKIGELRSELIKEDSVYLIGKERDEWTEYDKLKPIQLTEELLLKFGLFKIQSVDDKWDVGYSYDDVFAFDEKIECSDFYIKRINDLFYFMIATIDDGNASSLFLNDLDYVHNFQNLCFALKDEELTFEDF